MTLEARRDFELPPDDAEYLATAPWLSDDIRGRFATGARFGTNAVRIPLTRSEAESLGGHLTERLATVGFDSAYELTLEGGRLESLIDVFVWR